MHGRNFKPATQIESRPNFSSLLDECPGEVKFLPPVPQGSYVAVVQPGWRHETNTRTGTDYHEFLFKLIQALEDVDPDELEEFGDISETILRRQFSITPKALPYLDDFHQACGLDLAKLQRENVSRLLRNDEVVNTYVGVYVKHRPWSDGSGKTSADIDRFFRIEEE
jgi:hypothetical protein